MTPSNQPNNQFNTNSNQNAKSTPNAAAPLANKSQNEQMMGSLKNLDSKLEAAGNKDSARETSDETDAPAKNTSAGTGRTQKPAPRGEGEERGNKQMKKVGSKNESEDSEEGESKGLSLESFKDMNLSLNKVVDLSKGYFKKDLTAPYLGKLGSEVGEQVIDYVQEWAEKNNANIAVSVTSVSSSTPMYAGIGAATGAGLGWAFGGKVGGLVGVIFGAALGTAASCVSVKFHADEASEGKSAPVVH